MTYNSENGGSFVVHKPEGSTRVFQESFHGLYYHGTSHIDTKEDPEKSAILVTTVAKNANNYSNAHYAWALLACKVQNIIGCPSTWDFLKIVENKSASKLSPNARISWQPSTCLDLIEGCCRVKQ